MKTKTANTKVKKQTKIASAIRTSATLGFYIRKD